MIPLLKRNHQSHSMRMDILLLFFRYLFFLAKKKNGLLYVTTFLLDKTYSIVFITDIVLKIHL